jgi:murein L,D-transpeptidase YcbB/YkuD
MRNIIKMRPPLSFISRATAALIVIAAVWLAAGARAQTLIAERNPGDQPRIATLYADNGHRLLWSDGRRPSSQAVVLLQELRQAANRGLDPADYAGEQLASRLTGLLDSPRAGIEAWAEFDASLSQAGVRFLSDLHYGRIDPATVGHNLTVERIRIDIPAALAQLAGAVDVPIAIDALEPQFEHYGLLKRELARYRALAAEPGLNALPPLPVKAVKPGEDYAGAAQLQHLLRALGDAPADDPGAGLPEAVQSLTPALVAALKHFEARHGETPDGVLGAATYAELTKPLALRVEQIELTMERWRWMPSQLSSAPIIVNIPEFRLFAFDSTADAEAHIRQMDVIVGKAYQATETPVFSADMTYVIFRPYWEVPYSIARREVVPAARSHPEIIAKHQMEIVRGTGDTAVVYPNTPENVEAVAKGSLRLRQKPGPNNSLGLVKFMLPNPYNVYLHSTPAQALFADSRRDFSHGCVRVSDPIGLAQYVLREAPEWTREKIEAAMNGTSPVTVTLKHPIRVFIVYGTALAMEDGEVMFFDDIYGHDRRLVAALNSRRPWPVAAPAPSPADIP